MRVPEALPPHGGEHDALFVHRVIAVEIRVDPDTHDRLFIIHTEDAEPLALRVEPVHLADILRRLSLAIVRSLH